jgi:hypothetical protein
LYAPRLEMSSSLSMRRALQKLYGTLAEMGSGRVEQASRTRLFSSLDGVAPIGSDLIIFGSRYIAVNTRLR